jgi:UDP-2,3-diacylglucosamine pyrophosphatase LpxH
VRLAVISDLHIGADEFDRNAPGFVDFLRFLEDDHDEIILLGDVYDSPTGTKSSRSTSIRSGRERRKPTCGSPIA